MHRQQPANADSKSQNSDYGSFCNTPCDMNGAAAATAATESSTKGTKSRSAAGEDGSPPATGGSQPDADRKEDEDKVEEDNSVMDAYQRQPLLNSTSHHDSCSSDDDAGGTNASGYTRRKSRHPQRGNPVHIDMDTTSSEAPLDELDDVEIPGEPLKTLLAFVFLFCAWVATTLSLALTHDRVPDYAPLPDAFLDNITFQSWGLEVSEIIIMIAMTSTFTLAIFHQHRSIVLRRIFFIAGLHYFYRAITMYITVLPVADTSYVCMPKQNGTTFVEIALRVVKLLSGMGLSINKNHVYCGDYIYSGHTMTLVMTFLVIKEYSPRRWFLLHWLSFCMTVTGVITLLFARGHYSIDVLIAYWITTRVWWIYHTMANNPQFMIGEARKNNYLLNIWWMYIFQYFEGRVGRPVPKGFNFPWPSRLRQYRPEVITTARSRRRRTRREAEDAEAAEAEEGVIAGGGLP